MSESSQVLRTTALHGVHADLGATFTDFGGWDMPLRYSSDLSSITRCGDRPGSSTCPTWARSR